MSEVPSDAYLMLLGTCQVPGCKGCCGFTLDVNAPLPANLSNSAMAKAKMKKYYWKPFLNEAPAAKGEAESSSTPKTASADVAPEAEKDTDGKAKGESKTEDFFDSIRAHVRGGPKAREATPGPSIPKQPKQHATHGAFMNHKMDSSEDEGYPNLKRARPSSDDSDSSSDSDDDIPQAKTAKGKGKAKNKTSRPKKRARQSDRRTKKTSKAKSKPQAAKPRKVLFAWYELGSAVASGDALEPTKKHYFSLSEAHLVASVDIPGGPGLSNSELRNIVRTKFRPALEETGILTPNDSERFEFFALKVESNGPGVSGSLLPWRDGRPLTLDDLDNKALVVRHRPTQSGKLIWLVAHDKYPDGTVADYQRVHKQRRDTNEDLTPPPRPDSPDHRSPPSSPLYRKATDEAELPKANNKDESAPHHSDPLPSKTPTDAHSKEKKPSVRDDMEDDSDTEDNMDITDDETSRPRELRYVNVSGVERLHRILQTIRQPSGNPGWYPAQATGPVWTKIIPMLDKAAALFEGAKVSHEEHGAKLRTSDHVEECWRYVNTVLLPAIEKIPTISSEERMEVMTMGPYGLHKLATFLYDWCRFMNQRRIRRMCFRHLVISSATLIWAEFLSNQLVDVVKNELEFRTRFYMDHYAFQDLYWVWDRLELANMSKTPSMKWTSISVKDISRSSPEQLLTALEEDYDFDEKKKSIGVHMLSWDRTNPRSSYPGLFTFWIRPLLREMSMDDPRFDRFFQIFVTFAEALSKALSIFEDDHIMNENLKSNKEREDKNTTNGKGKGKERSARGFEYMEIDSSDDDVTDTPSPRPTKSKAGPSGSKPKSKTSAPPDNQGEGSSAGPSTSGGDANQNLPRRSRRAHVETAAMIEATESELRDQRRLWEAMTVYNMARKIVSTYRHPDPARARVFDLIPADAQGNHRPPRPHPTWSHDVQKKAIKQLLLIYHPDRNPQVNLQKPQTWPIICHVITQVLNARMALLCGGALFNDDEALGDSCRTSDVLTSSLEYRYNPPPRSFECLHIRGHLQF
ncbi:hypothetical protein SISNIDRAFT_464013 [Sistotremastrum niveocremeum HHB9708]|uniref:J domain-containing protein n=1 Tax=Sistotremastrum niveocremeum HHB9708 TaxID=1314777 RepID=A0A164Y3J6_9AGAM|nr:hypothetical protein SISNIDRAFT_464013 [Sistotremastrum niveocremeum HHB9708]